MSVQLVATARRDGPHLAPTGAAHESVSALGADSTLEDEIDAMVEDIKNVAWDLPDEVMRLCQAYMARCTEIYLQLVRLNTRAATFIKNQQLAKVMELLEFTYKAASRSVEIRRQDVEMSK